MRSSYKLLGIVAIAVAGTACTPEEIEQWHQWHAVDPAAAQAHLQDPAVQAELDHHLNPPPPQEPREERQESGGGSVWDRVAECESNGNWSINTGNGYYGGLQFSLQSWEAAGGDGMPHHASRAEQIRVAENLLDMQGWGAWPTCSRQLGLR
jgi:hypothetical protein